ncbi:hypothetical protein JT73_14585, partial [Listeria monocytogenes]
PCRKQSQVDEGRIRRLARELSLRNAANGPRNFGRRGALVGCKPERAAVNRPRRLFSKNTGLCKAVRCRIGTHDCPVLEGYEACLASAKERIEAPVNGGPNLKGL